MPERTKRDKRGSLIYLALGSSTWGGGGRGGTSPNTHFLKALAAGSLEELANSNSPDFAAFFPFPTAKQAAGFL